MHPLTSLITEHQVMTRLVDGLAGYAQCLERGACGDTDGAAPKDLARFARFFRAFADEIHHEKEESILLPTLTRHGFSWDEGVIADVRGDHEQERYLIDVLCQASERCLDWNSEDRRSIAATALELSEFQRAHLTRENTELFEEMARRLDADAFRTLQDELERFDAFPRHRELRLELVQLAEQLIGRYAPAAPGLSRPSSKYAAAQSSG